MALLPPIPERPADRPETLDEYRQRRAVIAMRRQFNDQLVALVRSDGLVRPIYGLPPFAPLLTTDKLLSEDAVKRLKTCLVKHNA